MRALFCNELGEGRGHLSPYVSLLEALGARGWEVGAAVRATGEAVGLFAGGPVALMQAPVCVARFDGLPREQIDFNEILLGSGYGHEDTFRGMYAAWKALLRLHAPDLVIASFAPTAALAARALGIPAVRIGTGWDCPPAVDPQPLFRAWEAGIERRREASARAVLATVNAALRAEGDTPVGSLSELHGAPTLLCTYEELDPFRDVRGGGDYLGVLPAPANARQGGEAPDCDIFVYGRVTPVTDLLVDALRKLPAKSAAWFADMSEAERAVRTGGNLRMLSSPANVAVLLPRVRVVVGYAGHGLTAEALRAGVPMLLTPVHQEQYVTAKRVAEAGAGLLVDPWDAKPKFARALERLLDEPAFAERARAFGARLAARSPEAGLERAVERCASLARVAAPRLRSVVG